MRCAVYKLRRATTLTENISLEADDYCMIAFLRLNLIRESFAFRLMFSFSVRTKKNENRCEEMSQNNVLHIQPTSPYVCFVKFLQLFFVLIFPPLPLL